MTLKRFDFLIVGAGLAGCVIAERLASLAGSQVLLVERRNHIGGNCYDEYDRNGILLQRYGPHIVHTNDNQVIEYLSRFTGWRPYQHRVVSYVDGMYVPFPVNLDTVNRLYGTNMDTRDLERFLDARAERKDRILNAEDLVVSKLGRELFDKFYRGYTRKQWGVEASELQPDVTGRIPVRLSRDPRYFTDTYQCVPQFGYTVLFRKLLSHPNISVMLGTDFHKVEDMVPFRHLVYTGCIDEFFGYRYGRLPYRSVRFDFETVDARQVQVAPVINYPNDHEFVRSTDMKQITGQSHEKSVVLYEYPLAEGDPCYPVPIRANRLLAERYREIAGECRDVTFAGRLGTYRYMNIDAVVRESLDLSSVLIDG